MRIVAHEKNEPYKIKIKDIQGIEKLVEQSQIMEYELHICACGLSQNKPFCDGSHRITRDENPDNIYAYNEEKERVNVGKFYSSKGKI